MAEYEYSGSIDDHTAAVAMAGVLVRTLGIEAGMVAERLRDYFADENPAKARLYDLSARHVHGLIAG